jgi:hypothetical protein
LTPAGWAGLVALALLVSALALALVFGLGRA